MTELAGKITFATLDLSAYAVASLAHALQVKGLPVSQNAKDKRAAPLNVELVISEKGTTAAPTAVHGETSVCDFVAHLKNHQDNATSTLRIGQSFAHDGYVHQLAALKAPVTDFAINKNEASMAQVKALLAQVEAGSLVEDLFTKPKFTGFQIAHAMLFCYLEPVKVLASEALQKHLTALQESHGLMSFEAFVQAKGKYTDAAKQAKGKDVKFDESNVKLTRLNHGAKILPKEGKRNVLITSALPYVNNVPHLGNIIGCVLSGDVFARFCRLRGYNTIYVCGTDEYGTATETKAIQEGMTPKEICDKYHEIHKAIYKWFDIDFELFGRTSTPKHTEITQEIFNGLHKEKNTYEEVIKQQYCGKCERFLADRFVNGECPMCHFYDARGDQCDGCGKLINAIELINPKCSLCKGTPEPRESKHIFIDLGKIQPKCQEFIEKQSVEGKWSYNATFFTNNLLKEGLHGRCITRDLKWGTPIPMEEYNNKVFYVWFDAPIGYISITANYLGAENEDYRKWWQNKENVELYQFMGKDNTTFHTLIFPSTMIGSGQPWTLLKTISTTEFLNYEIDEETGKPKKFSKSRGIGIFGDDAKNTGIPAEVWRYYLLSNRPEQQDTVFLWKDFIAKNNSELLKNLGNFSNRCLKFLAATFDGVVPAYEGERHADDTKFIQAIYAQFEEYLDLLEKIKIKDGLRVAMNVSSLCNTYWQDSQLWTLAKTDKKRANQVMNTAIQVMQVLAAMLEPYMPSFSAKIYHQLALKRTETHEVLFEFLAGHPERIESLIPGGHKIGEPQPIFREISEEEMENLKKRYG